VSIMSCWIARARSSRILLALGNVIFVAFYVVSGVAVGATPAVANSWNSALKPNSPRYTLHLNQNKQEAILRTPDGAWLANLLPTLNLSYAKQRRRGALDWQSLKLKAEGDSSWTMSAETRWRGNQYRYSLRYLRGDPQLRGRFVVTYGEALSVRREALSFRLAKDPTATVLDRAYRWRDVKKGYVVGNSTPMRLRIQKPGAVTFVGDAGAQTMAISRRRKRNAILTLEIENRKNHPFATYKRCVTGAKEFVGRKTRPYVSREPSQSKVVEMRWILGAYSPVLVGRFPKAYASAMVFVDHADHSNRDKLEAFAYGETGALARGQRGPTQAGFVNRGLRYTKSVFVKRRRGYASQLDNASYVSLAKEMQKAGVEIGLHSISGGRDRPAVVASGLADFRKHFSGRTWVDHQPTTNCEAISNLGSISTSPWHLLDYLQDRNIRYLWSGLDTAVGGGGLNMLAPNKSSRIVPVHYPLAEPKVMPPDKPLDMSAPSGGPFIVFNSLFMYRSRPAFLAAYGKRRLDRFAKERGIHLAHVYLDGYFRQGRFAARSLLERRRGGGYRLAKEVDYLWQELANRQQRSEIWVTTVEALFDHLRAAMRARAEYFPGGKVLVKLHRPLRNPTFITQSQTEPLGKGWESRHRSGHKEWWQENVKAAEFEFTQPGETVEPATVVVVEEE